MSLRSCPFGRTTAAEQAIPGRVFAASEPHFDSVIVIGKDCGVTVNWIVCACVPTVAVIVSSPTCEAKNVAYGTTSVPSAPIRKSVVSSVLDPPGRMTEMLAIVPPGGNP